MSGWYERLPPWKYRVTLRRVVLVPELRRRHGVIRSPEGVMLAYLGNGWLHALPGYAWDGPSGPAIDTKTFMLPSLFHDMLYQMIREGELEPGLRATADRVMRRVAKDEGMSFPRRWWTWAAVRLGGRVAL